MSRTDDEANVIVQPPIAWAIAILAGFGLNKFYPTRFLPDSIPRAWIGGSVFAAGFALGIWAVLTFRRAGTHVPVHQPTTTIVTGGPFRFTRNPIYTGMFLGQLGLAIAFTNPWMLATLVPFYLVIRYGVVAREEIYLGRKFGDAYLNYKARVRRWL